MLNSRIVWSIKARGEDILEWVNWLTGDRGWENGIQARASVLRNDEYGWRICVAWIENHGWCVVLCDEMPLRVLTRVYSLLIAMILLQSKLVRTQ